ncbi:glutathione S-transferase family protein [Paracoccus sp. MBLB3053]|uniref:Glutathione S-transferase family protein n=1 Tax=Paracoccus aurantius TaxID=3073814 RepID=A0ABU2HSX1_9RHOB|nr:glutathione S-transferase family protein [Paracoccus sp. MBLB3053]MDS9468138.1 glutathione S-transferase family protein [Paracoccus sp. MBLB3053]
MPTITAFAASPDKGAGLARDMRVRWVLEEAGQPYDVRLVTFEEMKQPEYLALHPFAQIPAYEDEDVSLFESGAIVLHVAERHHCLLPEGEAAHARAISWMFAALNTVEPPIVERDNVRFFEADRSGQADRFALVDERIRTRLHQLAAALGDAEWLVGNFSAADILMVHAIRRLEGSGILEEYQVLMDYIARAQARPAYQRAFSAQYEVFQNLKSP